MSLKCVAIDDEPPALEVLRQYIAALPELELVQAFDDAVSGGEFIRTYAPDLLFIDIDMPDVSGLELVRSLSQKPMIIFTTAHKKFAHEGFELDAVDYLLKPVIFERFARAVNKALEYDRYRRKPTAGEGESLFVYAEYRMVKIPLEDIEYIESLEDYIRIHLVNGKPILTLLTLKAVLEKLPPAQFRRIHRSYIVSVAKVRSIHHRRARLLSTELPISDSYARFVEEWKKA